MELTLREWQVGEPEKLVLPLQHAYTPAELSFETLKGPDAAVAGVLIAAARQADCELHLALVTVDESGSAEYNDNYRRSRFGSDAKQRTQDLADATQLGGCGMVNGGAAFCTRLVPA